jgi:hypothetical protein
MNPESLSERIIRLQAEDLDPITQLMLEVRAEARATHELLEETRKTRGGGGIGNGRFATIRDIVVVLIVPLLFVLGGFMFAIGNRVTALEAQAVHEGDLNAAINSLEIRARAERVEAIGVLRDQLERHEDRDRRDTP